LKQIEAGEGEDVPPAGTVAPSALHAKLIKAKNALMKKLSSEEIFESTPVGTTANVSGKSNIVGFGIGDKLTGGHFTSHKAVKVYVVRKMPMSAIEAESQIPKTIKVDGEEYPTDVEEVGEIIAYPTVDILPAPTVGALAVGVHTERARPAPCGSSVGHFRVTAGTIGALVEVDGSLMMLSNNHVLANANDASKDDPILQPGTVDGGKKSSDRVGRLMDWTELDFSGAFNDCDAAVAITSFDKVDPEHFAFVIDPEPILDPKEDMAVRKDGRTTGHTKGVIRDVHATVKVRYGNHVATFHNQIRISSITGKPFSQPGDSGSLIVDATTIQPVGLLFAGGTTDTFANPIRVVMDRLNIARFIAEVEE
jgi:hypothetical protein